MNGLFKPLVIQQKTHVYSPLLLSETLHNCEVSCLERINTHTHTHPSALEAKHSQTLMDISVLNILNLQPTIQRSIVAEIRERAVDKTIYIPPYPTQLTHIIFTLTNMYVCVYAYDICKSQTHKYMNKYYNAYKCNIHQIHKK